LYIKSLPKKGQLDISVRTYTWEQSDKKRIF